LDGAVSAALVMASVALGADFLVKATADVKIAQQIGSVHGWQTHLTVWWIATATAAAAVSARQIWPLPAVAAAAMAVSAHMLDSVVPLLPIDIAALIALYTYASQPRPRRSSMAALAALLLGLYAVQCIATVNAFGPSGGVKDVFSSAAVAAQRSVVPGLLIAIAWAMGDSTRIRRTNLALLQARAADAERDEQQRTALAVEAERNHIARELHDIVAHGLSVMVVQAQGATAALERHPDRSREAMAHVITTGRASLAEMRRLLGLVGKADSQAREPQPSLALLPDLLDRVRATGTPVRLRVTGEPFTLPATVELTAFRIVQEALTNSLKHAGPGVSCRVELAYREEAFHLRIADTGPGVPPPTPGNGLRGITERVYALGGTLYAGPGREAALSASTDCSRARGFEIDAVLPLPRL
jgi:signal transduction histidine kinase